MYGTQVILGKGEDPTKRSSVDRVFQMKTHAYYAMYFVHELKLSFVKNKSTIKEKEEK